MSNFKIKNVIEKNTINPDNNPEKQIELIFENQGKTDKIQLAGNGILKVSATV